MNTVKGIFAAILAVLLLRVFLLDLFLVEGVSMEPDVPSGAVVLVSKAAYGIRNPWDGTYWLRWNTPKPADILLLEDPSTGSYALKRCVTLTPHGVYVRGDNGPYSVDSRLYGSLPVERVRGKVILTIPGKGR